eukprot:Pompholyxophrys_punicea_v1_NODE_851_length_1214_cov_3.240725.p1 type:complete len:140 gc:universal NODE_851_length_1214_cov_3.240725:128-547(+)
MALRDALSAVHVSVYLCEVLAGLDIQQNIVAALAEAHLVIIMGSKTYGEKTDSHFSTHQELCFILEEEKPFFLIKMCDDFASLITRFSLPKKFSYFTWDDGPIPNDLVPAILQRLMNQKQVTNFRWCLWGVVHVCVGIL